MADIWVSRWEHIGTFGEKGHKRVRQKVFGPDDDVSVARSIAVRRRRDRPYFCIVVKLEPPLADKREPVRRKSRAKPGGSLLLDLSAEN
jgi:hypothetical protein